MEPGIGSRRRRAGVLAALIVCTGLCLVAAARSVGADVSSPDLSSVSLALTPVATGLARPVAAAWRKGDSRMYVVQQAGSIVIVNSDGTTSPTPVLSLSGLGTANEQGLLGLAFSSDGAKLYVDFVTADGNIHVGEYTMAGDVADTSTYRELLAIPHPVNLNHYGGEVAFGPDGDLYIGTGDGGGAGDPAGNAQNTDVLLGKILRIDPTPSNGMPYTIPPDNPFVRQAGTRPEIWMYGLRNPWRYSFDSQTGDMWIGDVGESSYEEVDLATAGQGGQNYGWNLREGFHQYLGPEPTGAVDPLFEEAHTNGWCALIGGYVYRGSAIANLNGAYVFGDLCRARLVGVVQSAGQVLQQADLGVSVSKLSSFAQDPNGEIYAISLSGTIYQLTQGTPPTTTTTTTVAPTTTTTTTVASTTTTTSSTVPSKVDQTITFGALGDVTLADSPVTASASASSGLPVSFSTSTPDVCTSGGGSGASISLVGTGLCTVQADQAGDGAYNAAPPVVQSFTVLPVEVTTTTTVAPVEGFSVSPGALGFGSQRVGTHGAPRAVTLKNTGTVPVVVQSVAIGGANAADFVASGNCGPGGFPVALAPGVSCNLGAAFVPTAAGPRAASFVTSFSFDRVPVAYRAALPSRVVALSGAGTEGYYLADARGVVRPYGDAASYGDARSVHLAASVISLATSPTGRGYWLLGNDGGVFSYGDAHFYGSTGNIRLNKPIVDMSPSGTGRGYRLVGSDGGVFAYGDAHFYGSTGSIRLNKPIVGITSTPSGRGYWLVASDGGVFAFGDARFRGSGSGVHLMSPVVQITDTPSGNGYWLLAANGQLLAFGDAHSYGSAAGQHLVGMASTPDGHGYWETTTGGRIFAFGNAVSYGDLANLGVNDVVGVAGTAPMLDPRRG
ncbi:MAG TPA: PQQ-dependent sugar dehydrogenase [Acidimicrobiia bacterium]|nr:PQQ-dependent sugar dehydrogenase [Acidimicrobiia bacterium]